MFFAPGSDSIAALAAAAGATFLTGLVGSGHCALMCGPLACSDLADPRRRARRRAALAWQAGRAGAYTVAGAGLGAAGATALALLRAPAARALPWVIAAGLVVSALEIGRRLPALPGLRRIPRALARLGAPLPATARAALRGAATPFLPCGLIYGAFVVAAGSGSAVAGAAAMAAFALGGVPALALAQAGGRRLAAHPRAGRVLRVAVPLAGAAVVVWRALAAAGGHACH
jgi:sulfite exporter TauE/SafE